MGHTETEINRLSQRLVKRNSSRVFTVGINGERWCMHEVSDPQQ